MNECAALFPRRTFKEVSGLGKVCAKVPVVESLVFTWKGIERTKYMESELTLNPLTYQLLAIFSGQGTLNSNILICKMDPGIPTLQGCSKN